MDISWRSDWPRREVIREEVEAYADVVSDVLPDVVSSERLRGLYYKGPSLKPWESALDYVPDISDVDFHVWLSSDDDASSIFESMEVALDVQERLEKTFASRMPSPVHYPRPQLVIMNALLLSPDYVAPPVSQMRVLFGESCPSGDYDSASTLETDRRQSLSHEGFLKKLPGSAIDKPGRLLWKVFVS